MTPCKACPFMVNESEEAAIAENYGCLPSGYENLQTYDKKGYSISCHNTDKICHGLLRERPDAINKPIQTYTDWYQGK